MTKGVLISAGIAVALAIPGGYVFTARKRRAERGQRVQTCRVARRSFTVMVRTVGELDAARSTVVSSRVRGQAKLVYVIEDGKRVSAGDVLVRLDATPFEEKAAELRARAREHAGMVAARQQILAWEKSQADREHRAAEFDVRVAELRLRKLEKGDGPQQLGSLESVMLQGKREYEEMSGYLDDLADLRKKGYVNDAEIHKAKSRATEAKRSYDLVKKQYDSYRLYVLPMSIEEARSDLARAKMALEQTGKSSGFKIGKAMADLRDSTQKLEAGRAALKRAEEELAQTVIRAPIPGMVVLREEFRSGQKRKPRVGDVVWQNQPLVYLPDISAMVAHAKIREIDLHKVAVGKPAVIVVDAYPDLRLPGVVERMGVLAEKRSGERGSRKYFRVVVSVKRGDRRLRPGMTSRVEIICAQVDGAVAVPVHAVFRERSRSVCYVEKGGRYEVREIVLGAQNETWAEVRKGLAVGHRAALAKPPAEQIEGVQGVPIHDDRAGAADGT